jgi:hypothetical protein
MGKGLKINKAGWVSPVSAWMNESPPMPATRPAAKNHGMDAFHHLKAHIRVLTSS